MQLKYRLCRYGCENVQVQKDAKFVDAKLIIWWREKTAVSIFLYPPWLQPLSRSLFILLISYPTLHAFLPPYLFCSYSCFLEIADYLGPLLLKLDTYPKLHSMHICCIANPLSNTSPRPNQACNITLPKAKSKIPLLFFLPLMIANFFPPDLRGFLYRFGYYSDAGIGWYGNFFPPNL